jgi:hypothetical protein
VGLGCGKGDPGQGRGDMRESRLKPGLYGEYGGGGGAKIKMPPRGCRVGRGNWRTGKVGTCTVAARIDFVRELWTPRSRFLACEDARLCYYIIWQAWPRSTEL